jgi:RIO-like serine/threonine protein kinase
MKQIFGISTDDFTKIGGGKEGSIYLSLDKKILKIYYYSGRITSEYKILKEMENCPYFPKVLECQGKYMLREYVDGTPYKEYIQEKGLSRRVALNLIKFVEKLNKANISFDGLENHIFIRKNKKIMAIDPVKREFPIHYKLFEDLKELGVLDKFIKILKKKRPDLASNWLDNLE